MARSGACTKGREVGSEGNLDDDSRKRRDANIANEEEEEHACVRTSREHEANRGLDASFTPRPSIVYDQHALPTGTHTM